MHVARKQTRGADDSLNAMLDRISNRAPPNAPPPRPSGGPPVDPAIARPAVEATPAIVSGPRPWVPASASIFVWGAGQGLNGQRPLGTLLFVLQVLTAATVYCLLRTWESWVWLAGLLGLEEVGLKAALAGLGLAIPALVLTSVTQAYLRARRLPGARHYRGVAVIPGMASALVPGWGQILSGHLGKGVLFLSAWLFGLYVLAASQIDPGLWARLDPSVGPIAGLRLSIGATAVLLLVALGWVLGVYDALTTGRRVT